MNTDFHGVKGVRLFTVRTPYARCKSPRKSVVIPCKSVVIHGITTDLCGLHNGLTRTFATCVQCPHGEKMDSFDPVEVCIQAPFSLCVQKEMRCMIMSSPSVMCRRMVGLHCLYHQGEVTVR